MMLPLNPRPWEIDPKWEMRNRDRSRSPRSRFPFTDPYLPWTDPTKKLDEKQLKEAVSGFVSKQDALFELGCHCWPEVKKVPNRVGCYYGSVEDGHSNGRGTFRYNNGELLVCYWVPGIGLHGIGLYRWKDGDVRRGVWKDNKLERWLD